MSEDILFVVKLVVFSTLIVIGLVGLIMRMRTAKAEKEKKP